MVLIKSLLAPIRRVAHFPLFQFAVTVAVILWLQAADSNSVFGEIFSALDWLVDFSVKRFAALFEVKSFTRSWLTVGFIGVIQRLMIDKLSGQIAYAVLSFGGFLGFGQKHFPVPWRSLKYNPKHGAYEFEVTEEQLRAAPSFAPGEEFDWGDRSDEIQILVRHYPVHHGWE